MYMPMYYHQAIVFNDILKRVIYSECMLNCGKTCCLIAYILIVFVVPCLYTWLFLGVCLNTLEKILRIT